MIEKRLNFGVYALYDCVTVEYGLPFVSFSGESAIRSAVSSLIALDDNVISDFELFEIGQFDKDNGRIEGYETNISICGSHDLLKKVIQLRAEIDEQKKEALEELEALKKLRQEVK